MLLAFVPQHLVVIVVEGDAPCGEGAHSVALQLGIGRNTGSCFLESAMFESRS
jgi:hypothetical protein